MISEEGNVLKERKKEIFLTKSMAVDLGPGPEIRDALDLENDLVCSGLMPSFI